MIRGAKLAKLLEQNMQSGKGTAGFKKDWDSFLGITEAEDGVTQVLDPKSQVVNAREVSWHEVAQTFLGRHYGASDLKHAFRVAEQYSNFKEADGATVLPSHFANISAFTDTISGLVNALRLEVPQMQEFIHPMMVDDRVERMQGGYLIRPANDGEVSGNLLDGEPYPTVGMKETKVHVPDNARYGNAIEINEKVFLYDLTDMIQETVTNSGKFVLRQKEIRVADCVLGITNVYSRDGNASNTYQATAGFVPNNYINSSLGTPNKLTDWHDLDDAIQVLQGNTDPQSGVEVEIPWEAGLQLLVMPQRRFNTVNILYPEWVRQTTNSAVDTRQSPSPLPKIELIAAPRLWYNRLIAAGVSAVNAVERYHLGVFKKAFRYRTVIPYSTASFPINFEQGRRDVLACYVTREHGVPYPVEPRFAYQGTNE